MKKNQPIIARILLTVLTAAAVAAIFYNSSLDAVASSEQSGSLLEAVNRLLQALHLNIAVTETVLRKAAHFAEYAVLGALLTTTAYLYVPRRGRSLLLALPLGACVAVGDELIQLFPAGRSCEVRDMLIDFSGIVFAAAAVMLITFCIDKRRKVKQ